MVPGTLSSQAVHIDTLLLTVDLHLDLRDFLFFILIVCSVGYAVGTNVLQNGLSDLLYDHDA
jgi:hypothetical protein